MGELLRNIGFLSGHARERLIRFSAAVSLGEPLPLEFLQIDWPVVPRQAA